MDDAIMADTQGIDPELVNALIELGREKGNQRIAALGAELERVTAERDARDHECHRLRDVLCDRNEDLAAAEARAVIAERERDAARAAAAALRKWGVAWRVIAWDSERFQQFRTFDNIQQMWATVRPDVEYGDSHND